MRAVVTVLAFLLVVSPAAAQPDGTPPPPPRALTVDAPALEATGALFKVSWETVLDPPGNQPVPVYRWTAGFNDGTAPTQGAVAGTVLMLRMPYHAGGARPGFVCVMSEDAAANVSVSVTCANVAIPARPSSKHTIDYLEPTATADGKPIDDLAAIRLYWKIDDGAETMVTLPASSPKGGILRRFELTVPALSGTLSVTVSAIDTSGNESPRSAPVTKVFGPDK
jgi:hypothetical protein